MSKKLDQKINQVNGELFSKIESLIMYICELYLKNTFKIFVKKKECGNIMLTIKMVNEKDLKVGQGQPQNVKETHQKAKRGRS